MNRFHLVAVVAAGLAALSTPPAVRPAVAQGPSDTLANRDSAPVSGLDLSDFDRSVRPQDDFYRFADGGWIDRTPIPADRSSIGTFDVLRERADADLHEILEELAADAATPGSERRKVADFYRSFMDVHRIEELGMAPIRDELEAIDRLEDPSDLAAWLGRDQRERPGAPIRVSISPDEKDADRYVAHLSQGGLGLPDRDYYLRGDDAMAAIREAYRTHVARMFGLAGLADPAAAAATVLAIETRIAGIQWSRVKNRDREATYNPVAATDLGDVMPGFAWTRFLEGAGLDAVPKVVVRQPDYLAALDGLIAEVPMADWRTYLKWKVLDAWAPYLSDEFVDEDFDFSRRVLHGVPENRPRWKRAVDATDRVLGFALGKVYVERHFPPAAKARMERLVENLRGAFRESFQDLAWMSPPTRAEALEKLARFHPKIGYPDHWRDYDGLVVAPDDLVGNLRRSSEYEYRRRLDRIDEPVDRTEWFMTPQTVNAYYSSSMNEIVFPAGILQPPFFDMAADDAVNYGAIGAVIGHEMGHGFDDQGRKSDAEGNLRDWWTPEDAARYQALADRLAEQYDRYVPVDDQHINGELTVGENIGDLGGLTIAWRAYHHALGGREAPVLDGFTGDQRFFLGWARVWRARFRPEELRTRLVTDPHSPARFRVIGVVSNMTPFYAAFDVEPGDALYRPPAERVEMW